MHKRYWSIAIYAFLISIFLFSCVKPLPKEKSVEKFTLRIIHVNDTHSHLTPLSLTINKKEKTEKKLKVGGYAYIADYVKTAKKEGKNVLFLLAGDAVQGTLYYSFFKGEADISALKELSIDAMVLGNHEFDNGPEILWQDFVSKANFPILCANIYFKKPEKLQAKLKKYIIYNIKGEKVVILGLTTPDTKHISNPEENIEFKDVKETTNNLVQFFKKQGVNKIIVLSHLGYEQDINLAKEVEDIDIIVGGHSHTPLGKLEELGLYSKGPYPTVVYNHNKPVLVVTAWKWGYVLGDLKVSFDKQGVIVKDSWKNNSRVVFLLNSEENLDGLTKKEKAFFVVAKEDEKVTEKIEKYSRKVDKLKLEVVATALEDLSNIRIPTENNLNQLAPLVAKSMYLKTKSLGVDFALQNAGGVRAPLEKGEISISDIYEVLPFGNTLVLLELTGKKIKDVLEKAVDRALTGKTGPFPYLYGAKFKLIKTNPKGKRVADLTIYRQGNWQKIEFDQKYKLVTNSFVARGGDFYLDLKKATNQEDLGFIDAEVFLEFVRKQKLIQSVARDFYPIEF